MSENSVQIVKDIYAAFGRGDVASVLASFDPQIEWRQAEGHPYQPGGGPWIGPQAVLTSLFMRLAGEWDGFVVKPARFTGTSDGALVEGRYHGTYKQTGASIDMQFAHVWRLRDGKVASFQQYLDTAQLERVMGISGARTSAAGR